jgi:GAF domain-containing protein
MGRGAKPSKPGKAKRPVASESRESESSRVRDLEKRLAEALEQQTATAEILRVISGSPTDIQPVLEAVAESVARLCDSPDVSIFRIDGGVLHLAVHRGPIGSLAPYGDERVSLDRGTVVGRSVIERRTIHISDLSSEAEEYPEGSARARHFENRTVLSVPLLRGDVAIGAIAVRRTEARLFTDAQVALLQTFGDQAVVAIENVRLFTETKEALEQQTATAEILRVISSSPTSVEAVFDTILANALRLCDTPTGGIFTFDGQAFHIAAAAHWADEFLASLREAVIVPGPETPLRRVGLELRPSHVADIFSDPSFSPPEIYRREGMRTALAVPMLKEGRLIGALTFHRREVRPFTEKQIALIETFADQAVIAIENVRLFRELQERNREVTEALDRQTATAEVLRIISSSPTDVQPVFDAIASSALRLCDGIASFVFRYDGTLIHLAAFDSAEGVDIEPLRHSFPAPPEDVTLAGRAIRTARLLYIADIENDPDAPPSLVEFARANGFRSIFAAPMLRDQQAIGAIGVMHRDVDGFTPKQGALLKTFADQAVIAIENVRLFTELQEKNRALTEAHAQVSEALDQQTATAEILRVISQSPTDVQPVFDAIAESAARLCDGIFGIVYRLDGNMVQMVAHHNASPEGWAAYQALYPRPLNRQTNSGRAMLDGRVAITEDIEADAERSAATRDAARLMGLRSAVTVPLLHKERTIGALTVGRDEPGTFSPKQVALLQTFADQAVIAIENVRLFTELQARNRELTEALERQTATSEILRVISSSPTDVQPVFDAIARNAVALCDGIGAVVLRFDGEMLHLAGHHNASPEALARVEHAYPRRPARDYPPGRAFLDRMVVQVPELQAATEFAASTARQRGAGSQLAVPLLRDDEVIGVIGLARDRVGPFSSQQIEALQTFADQAVIAIENVRLFKELQARTGELTRSVGELRALGEVSQALSSTLDVDVVLNTIVTRANDLIGADGCTIFEYDEVTEQFHLRATRNLEPRLVELARGTPLRKGDQGILGQLPMGREAVQVSDITAGSYSSPISDALIEAGYRAVVAVPLIREDHLIGALTMNRKTPGEFPAETIELLRTFATQSALAIQNARLFREIEIKSRELEVASQHKSEFLANMSHELRTPLNAVIGFSEVLSERMFGDLNEKQDEYLKDIHASGQHLLSLINDILDLSKIEAGRMELEVTDFDLPMAIDNALTLIRERAARRSIALHTTIDERLGQVQADERKVRQVLLNLLSNAIKFTPEGGRIDVHAVPRDGVVKVSVTDTGVGIAPEDQEAVFEEFRQVGTADKKVEGTGLGLALSRKFIELHGGKIWVKSQVGAGSTFTFTVPVRRGE